MTTVTWLLLLGGVALNAAAQLLLKAATRTSGVLVGDGGSISWSAAQQLLYAVPLWFGLGCYAVSLFLWLGALSRVSVSIAYPMLSIGYVVNAFAAALLFSEPLSTMKLAGIGLIVAGVVVLARGSG
ncbi:MAG TPA: transporter [Steroidobacteraceae bacterium]|jgi:multidrug transporter EmrE-like cation transporter|nr:transporter [Steroidobacteraceae bacterium]